MKKMHNYKNVLFLTITLTTFLLNSCKKKDDVTTNELAGKEAAIADYKNNYLGSHVEDPGWTGNVTDCNAGSVPQTTTDMVFKRINYFRRLVGLNDNITMDASKFPMCQEAALMMKANNDLSHEPPSTWKCWTQSGFDGAGTSNLALGTHSVHGITLFIDDGYLPHVGHRLWVLDPLKTQFSFGTTDISMSLGVIGTAEGNTKIPQFIAYPPNGYMPSTLVFPLWSFYIPDADFSNATVSMTGPSGAISLNVTSKTKAIVWNPAGIVTNATDDVTYTVTVSGIANAPKTTYSYTTKIIKVD